MARPGWAGHGKGVLGRDRVVPRSENSLPYTYLDAKDPRERKLIAAAVVAANKTRVASLVRRLVRSPDHWREAEQVGAVGILVALEKYDPTLVGEDRGAAFWNFARQWVIHEIQTYLGNSVFWRKAPNRGRSEARKKQAEAVVRVHESIDLVNEPACTSPSQEERLGREEQRALLRLFASTLSARDRAVLYSTNSQRVRSRHYLDLVERATTFVSEAACP